jgi:hypothetical protein
MELSVHFTSILTQLRRGAMVTNSTNNNNNRLGRQHYFKHLCHYKYEAQQQQSEILVQTSGLHRVTCSRWTAIINFSLPPFSVKHRIFWKVNLKQKPHSEGVHVSGRYVLAQQPWLVHSRTGMDDLTCKMLSKRFFLPSIYSRIQIYEDNLNTVS